MDPLIFFLKSSTRDPLNDTAKQKIWKNMWAYSLQKHHWNPYYSTRSNGMAAEAAHTRSWAVDLRGVRGRINAWHSCSCQPWPSFRAGSARKVWRNHHARALLLLYSPCWWLQANPSQSHCQAAWEEGTRKHKHRSPTLQMQCSSSWGITQCSHCRNHVDFERKRERNLTQDSTKLSSHPHLVTK